MRKRFIILLLLLIPTVAFGWGVALMGIPGTAACTAPTQSADFVAANNDYISVPDHAELSFGDGSNDVPFTVFAQFKIDSPGLFSILCKGEFNIANAEYNFLVDTGQATNIYAILLDDSGNKYIGRTSSATINTATWYRIAFVYSGSGADTGIDIYLNEIAVDNGNISVSGYVAMEPLAADATIGLRQWNGSDYYGDGKVSMLRVWKGTAQSVAFLTAIANKTHVCLTAAEKVNLVLSMDLDGDVTDGTGTHTPVNNGADFVADAPTW